MELTLHIGPRHFASWHHRRETSAQEDTALGAVSDDDTLSARDRDGLDALVSESQELQE